MTDQRELDRLLGALLVEGSDEVADRVIEAALDQIDCTRQWRVVRLPWGSWTMNSTTKTLTSVAAVAVVGVLAVGAVLLLVRPGQPAAGGRASPTVAPGAAAAAFVAPDRVKAAGTLTACVDMTYPPSASYAADGKTPEGFDIDIAAEISRRLGVANGIHNVEFDYLIRDLRAGKCDLLIGDMTSTFGNRATQVDFVDYLRPWTGFLVAAGNPRGIRTAEDLAGKSVAVEPGFLSEASLRAASADLVAAGKPAIEIVTTTRSDEAWVEELVAGRIDALAGDSMAVVYDADKPPYAGKAEVGGPAIDPQPIGHRDPQGRRGHEGGCRRGDRRHVRRRHDEGHRRQVGPDRRRRAAQVDDLGPNLVLLDLVRSS
jgi:polar amino acid transport system substrate-binding protein